MTESLHRCRQGCRLFRFSAGSRLVAVAAALVTACFTAVPAGAVVVELNGINLVNVEDPGNVADITGYGAVSGTFWIGQSEITIAQYADFLNAVAKSDPRGLWNTSMGSENSIAGISRSGADGSYVYSVINTSTSGGWSGSRPITFVSWFDAARYTNWVANFKPIGPQSATTTDNGAYNVGTNTSGNAVVVNGTNPNTGAPPLFYLPTENQWYKAAYYSPVLNSGSGGYYQFATQSNGDPGNVAGGLPNQANYRAFVSGTAVYSVTQSPNYSATQRYLQDVNSFTASTSYYGTFDQTGNVSEWNDLTGAAGSVRGVRGGNWNNNTPLSINSNSRNQFSTAAESNTLGFRLASPVPEPATVGLLASGTATALGWSLLRRRKRN